MTVRGRDTRDGERGQILALMVISLLAIGALVAVAADTGFFFDYRRRMQSGADSAAMAGAEQLLRDLMSDTNVQTAGLKAAESNGFKNGVDDAQVTIHHPPVNGFYADRADKNNFVEAVIFQPRPTIFMAILGFQSATVSARAVAGIKGSDLCILAQNPTITKAINMNGGFTIDAHCRVASNSSDNDALDDSGGACMTATSIAVTGTPGGNSTCFTPTPKSYVPREPDPFAGVAAPRFALPCNAVDCTIDNTSSSYSSCKINNSGTYTLSPGVYCGGINIQGSSGCGTDVTFRPGTYVLYGGGFNANGSCLHGAGVTFYNTGTTSGTTKYGTVTVRGTVQGALYAPTSGPLTAILFFQDRTFSGGQDNVVNGSTGLTLQGTLYFPTTPVRFAGGASSTGAAAYTILIADTITFTGGATFSDDFSSLPDGSPSKAVALAE